MTRILTPSAADPSARRGVLLCGLNGSGKSTVGRALAATLGWRFLDAEDYFFPSRAPGEPYAAPVPREEAHARLLADVETGEPFVLAAVRCGVGPALTARLRLAVLLTVPPGVRQARLRQRSAAQFGSRALPGGDLHEREERFLAMAASRSEADLLPGLTGLPCPLLTLDGTRPVAGTVARLTEILQPPERSRPMLYTAKIEQTHRYPRRMKYLPETDSFIEKDVESLMHARNVRQPYGWIMETGTPPRAHLDVIVMTEKEYALGDEERVRIIGVFRRGDGDHKLVAVPEERPITDLSGLSEAERADLRRLYPRVGEGEGWFGRDRAEAILRDWFDAPKKTPS